MSKRAHSSSTDKVAIADESPHLLSPIPDLPNALLPLHREAAADRNTPWTHDQIREVAGHLIDKEASVWSGSAVFARLKLLKLRSGPGGNQPDDIMDFFQQVSIFEAMTKCSTPKTRTVTADNLVPLIDSLSKGYVKVKAEEFARVLSDVVGIDIAHSSADATAKWHSFSPTWEKYCMNHPKLMGIVRFIYLGDSNLLLSHPCFRSILCIS